VDKKIILLLLMGLLTLRFSLKLCFS